MARLAKKYRVPVLYYITPQVWAWRSGRSLKLKQRVDRMAVILPFEEAFFQKRGMKVDYVGHPILDISRQKIKRADAVKNLGLDGGNPVLALIPGSRDEEIRNLLPRMVEAVKIIAEQYPNIKCALPVAPSISEGLIQSFVEESPVEIKIFNGRMDKILNACDLALVTSGTATLETALMEVPMVIVYRISPVSFRAAKLMVKVSHIGLVNLVAGEEVARELIQDDLTPQKLADEALALLQVDQKREDMIKKLRMVNKRLGSGGASERTAKIALDMIERHDYGSNHFSR
jgi:lipid-A-disaccharide synthase